MKVIILDGLRHRRSSGYGVIARYLLLGLAERGVDVYVEKGDQLEWDELEPGSRQKVETLPGLRDCRSPDVVLKIGNPEASRKPLPFPTLLYTMNALGDLPDDWIEKLRRVDAWAVPSDFDRAVFSRYLDPVYTVRLSSDPRVFYPDPGIRRRGSQRFTFLCVASYGYRKGVDLLLEAYLQEFGGDEPVALRFQAAGANVDRDLAHVEAHRQRLNPHSCVHLSGEQLSPVAMNRLYNQVDAVVIPTRGDGWCMPVTEAMCCGKPVIVPRSTAMAEYLTDDRAFLVDVVEERIAEIQAPFGQRLRDKYGKPGNVCYPPVVSSLRAELRRVYEDAAERERRADAARSFLLNVLTWGRSAAALELALTEIVDRNVSASAA